MDWETVIGLEVHVQLLTASKIFSNAPARYGADPNTLANEVDLAMPGVLPVMNREAARMAVMLGSAIDARINRTSVFARKNYFYPDLPKGYQISQYELPIVEYGSLRIGVDGHERRIGIRRAHLEEDAGKSLHEDFHGMSGIDLNRAGIPLLEIVSDPDLRSAREAVAYLKKLHTLVRYLKICDGNMQEGSFRCDANVSVRPRGQAEFGTRAEIKNINSFRFVERAIEYEVSRQIEVIESGRKVIQETRLYDSVKDETRSMRSKEEANDYRYFPDPDLPPLVLSEEFVAAAVKALPELPDAKHARFMEQYRLSAYDAEVLTGSEETALYFEQTLKVAEADPKLVANWVAVELGAYLNRDGLEISHARVTSQALGGLIRRIADNTISGKIAKEVFEAMWAGEGDADRIIDAKGLRQITDTAPILAAIDAVLLENPKLVAQYRSGQEKVFGFLVGQVMKATRGKANPAEVNRLLRERLQAQ